MSKAKRKSWTAHYFPPTDWELLDIEHGGFIRTALIITRARLNYELQGIEAFDIIKFAKGGPIPKEGFNA